MWGVQGNGYDRLLEMFEHTREIMSVIEMLWIVKCRRSCIFHNLFRFVGVLGCGGEA